MHFSNSAPPQTLLWSQLQPEDELRHRYLALRHGQSEANVAGIVSSHPDVATVTHGLTSLGREQAAGAVDTVKDVSMLTHVVVYSSDFKRAWETADIFCAALRDAWQDTGKLVVGPCVDVRLRERWFGEHDGMSDNPDADGSLGGYPAVWAEDAADATHEQLGVESVASVVGRASQVVAELEALAGPPLVGAAAGAAPGEPAAEGYLDYRRQALGCGKAGGCGSGADGEGLERWGVVLVAHGDVLQILQTAFEPDMEPNQHRSLPHLPNAELRLLNQESGHM
eukprot:SAG22_NODE_1458_length_4379_cov_5.524766_3_plen_282_part_00